MPRCVFLAEFPSRGKTAGPAYIRTKEPRPANGRRASWQQPGLLV